MKLKYNLKVTLKNIVQIIVLTILFTNVFISANDEIAIPKSTKQILIVITDSITATKGLLYTLERDSSSLEWKQLNLPIKVVMGRNGLGWGNGIKNPYLPKNFPQKVEGDGRSPAGIFNLTSVFGYNAKEQMKDLKMPYIKVNEMTECIDDPTSKYYNQIVSKDKIEENDKVDWSSSEKMSQAGIYYELGVVVDYNCNPIVKNSGSCIFLHNWADSNETMAGCTGMAPEKMKEIILWLDESKNPTLIQLTKRIYYDLIEQWNLPKIKDSYIKSSENS
ncbi:MAG: L,D-transpeptidase family protein [Ignavibacteriae bacterium]|nr:L,D-transpeptidase family protein [Ignavibacteriota bacterium]